MNLGVNELEGILSNYEMSILFEIPEKVIYSTIGVYSNYSKKFNGVAAEHLVSHIKYNLLYRPGRAFFVEGKCINFGYFKKFAIDNLEKEFLTKRHIPNEISTVYV